jgi:formylglycine-generating enzyme required for sulfatase activity
MATVQGEVADFTPAPPVMVEQKPVVIGDYEILGKLGQGGMGAVYRARQLSLDRVVALKILPSQLEEEENYVARFQREAAVAAGLNHPNLVHVYASGVADGSHFIAMELVEGENLRQRVKRGALPTAEALQICLEVARGLQFAWQRAQLIHRDIKPSNIYLAEGGTVKVGDLGLAKSLLGQSTAGLTHTGTAIGTPHYISPEQARGDKSIDLRADIYSLGCTLYELLTGVTPYKGSDPLTVMMMHVNSPPPAIMKVLPQCPMPVGRLVNKMLRKARHERHQTYEELIAAMESAQLQLEQGPVGPSAVLAAWKEIGAAEQQGLVARGPSPAPVAKPLIATALPAARKSRTGLWLGGAVGLVLLGVGAWKLSSPSPAAGPRHVVVATPHGGAPPAAPKPPSSTATGALGGFAKLPPAIAARAVPMWDAPEKLPKDQRIRWEDGAVRLEGANVSGATASRDGILRAALRADAVDCAFALRRMAVDKCRVAVSFQEQQVTFFSRTSGGATREWALPRAFQPQEWLHLEFWIIGDRCTVFAEGQMLGSVRTSALPPEGVPMITANKLAVFRDATYIPLDGLTEAEARELAEATAPGGELTRTVPLPPAIAARAMSLWDAPEKLPKEKRNVHWENGALKLQDNGVSEPTRSRDAILRATLRADATSPVIALRVKGDARCRVSISFPQGKIDVGTSSVGNDIAHWPLPRAFQPDEWLHRELRTIGDDFTVFAEGQMLGTVHSTVLAEPGSPMLFAGHGLFRDVEYIPLDGLPAAEWDDLGSVTGAATPAASQAAPFTNSLGMKFVPVPITGGPTGGQRVLFSVWETRVRDYEDFARETKTFWPKPKFEQGPDHPAVYVSWNNARAFCAWLTDHERKAGHLPADLCYRLPSDHEWSCAVGIGSTESPNLLPSEKSHGRGDWPWSPSGSARFGNYCDEKGHAAGANSAQQYLAGYDDGYAFAAPVGSYPANPFGLYDLGGNAFEYCEDRFDGTGEGHSVRGGSFTVGDDGSTRSANRRNSGDAKSADRDRGVRVVLAPVGSATAPP